MRSTCRGISSGPLVGGPELALGDTDQWTAACRDGAVLPGFPTRSAGADLTGSIPLLLALLPQRAPLEAGGDEETRTPDPLLAKEMLFQLSYVPVRLASMAVCGTV